MESSEDQKQAATGGAGASAATPSTSDARFYTFDKAKLAALQKEKPWMADPKHFTNVAVSPSAIMKMVMHCARGVEKGIAKGGNPIEVMGLLLGRPDPLHPKTLIVTDAFPLPIEGFETRVIADDQAVVNHMISLNESLERSREEKFMGWYHSHPFDLGDHSHCFLSQTDLSTQLQWQRAEDPHGNPFVAMVLDPLRSTHLGAPEIKAFRAFPPEYQNSEPLLCPDGSIEKSEQLRLEHWGSCWNRYYELGVEYYMSSASRSVMEALTKNYLWISNLKRADPQHMVTQLQQASASSGLPNLQTTPRAAGQSSTPSRSAMIVDQPDPVPARGATSSAAVSTVAASGREWQPMVTKLAQVATQELAQASLQQVQQQVFAKPNFEN